MTKGEPDRTKPKRVLIAEDDFYFRSILKGCVEEAGYVVAEAEDGNQAQARLMMEDFDTVVSDIKMPGMTGLDLLKWLRTEKTTPMILMTGFNELIETQDAFAAGASFFLAKPFKKEVLLEALAGCLQSPEEEAQDDEEEKDSLYCKISIDDFISGSDIRYDIYIRLSESRYVKIAHSGQDISVERIRRYKEKDIQYLYVTKEDFRRYLGFNATLTKLASKSSRISKEKKLNLVRHTSETLVEHFYNDQLDAATFTHAKTIVETSTALLADSNDVFSLMIYLAQHSNRLYAHCVGVSFYSALIGRFMGWKSPLTLTKLSMGGLMHDIGKKEIPEKILNAPRRDLDAAQIALLESHTRRGVEILEGIPDIPADVLQVVAQHHENAIGMGYPLGLKQNKIHPLARVVALANEFCNLIIPHHETEKLDPKKALERLMTYHAEEFDVTCLSALLQAFRLDPQPEFFDSIRKRQRAA